MKFERIVALLVSLVLILGCFASCDIIGNNDDAEKPEIEAYRADVDIRFATDDNKIKDAVNVMSSESVVIVNKDNVSINTTAKTKTTEVDRKYTLIDGVLYSKLLVKTGTLSVSENQKASVEGNKKDEILNTFGEGTSIGVGDFYVADIHKDGDNFSYVCSDPFEELKTSLQKMVAARFAAIGATVTVKDVEYQLEVVDGRNNSSILSVNYSINLDGEAYSVIMRLYTTYSYDGDFTIALPEDADNYIEVPYQDIVK
ncbi:MAG: hypothetical protein IJX97_06770 [Clostridia bacterium]|nr:hypothetical protein [Clostridia bacterium]